MCHRTSDRSYTLPLLLSLFMVSMLVACDRTQTVSITAEDFLFTPQVVTVNSAAPLVLTIYNAGREAHEFDSPILMYVPQLSSQRSSKEMSPGIVLKPGQSVELAMAPPPGTYLYICRRKGHGNMTGTLVIE